MKKPIFILHIAFTAVLKSHAQYGYVQTFGGKQYVYVNGVWSYYDNNVQAFYPIVENVLTVKFKPNTSQSSKNQLAFQYSLQLLRSNSLGYYDYSFPSGNNIFTIATTLIQSSLVELVEISTYGNYVVTPNDPQFSQQWHLTKIQVPDAWNTNKGNSNITVAILDSGTDWTHADLGLGTNTYQNIFLNSGEDAWSNPNNPATGNGIDDDGNGLIDDWKGWNFDQNNNDSRGTFFHGTHVAGIVSAKTHNNTGIAGVAGGWNGAGVRMLICNVGQNAPNGSVLDDAILYSIVKGAKIIQLSLTVAQSSAIDAALQQAKNSGVLVICAAGNNFGAIAYPASNINVMSVGASDQNDAKANFSNFGAELDIAAPGTSIISTQIGNTYGNSDGTSFAAPIISGISALMQCQNNCISAEQAEDILKATAEKVGGYNYNWNPNKPRHSQELGYGRVNAKFAVEAAQASYSNTLDLFMKDVPEDYGVTYYTSAVDKSPDVWVRNHPDGLTNQIHQDPEYSATTPVYIYVRVRNKSCVASTGNEQLSVYWSKAASWSSWPQNWDGSQPTTGNKVNTVNIPVLQPGQSTILQISWLIPNPNILNNWATCLLARIEGITADPITVYPQRLDQDVYLNNNITIRNVTIVDLLPNKPAPGWIDGVYYPHGRFMYIGNAIEEEQNYDIRFKVPEGSANILRDAEVRVIFDADGWEIMNSSGVLNAPDIQIIGERQIRLLEDEVTLHDIPFSSENRIPIYVGFHFLIDSATSDMTYAYEVSQAFSEASEETIGTESFVINRYVRTPFSADAGPDKSIIKNSSTVLNATEISEAVIYNWYDHNDSLVYTGKNFMVSPEITSTYKLQVITVSDGFIDYDEAEVKVKNCYLSSVYPNPAFGQFTVNYMLEETSSAYLMLINSATNIVSNYLLDISSTTKSINTNSLLPGNYTVALVCDGQVADAKTIVIN